MITHFHGILMCRGIGELVTACHGLSGTLNHWGRVTHICVGNLTIIGSVNGLSPCRRQPIIWTNAGILLIGPFGINSIEILIDIQSFSFTKIHLEMSSGKWRPFCLGLNVLNLLWVLIASNPCFLLRHHFEMTDISWNVVGLRMSVMANGKWTQ